MSLSVYAYETISDFASKTFFYESTHSSTSGSFGSSGFVGLTISVSIVTSSTISFLSHNIS
jgi:hypothetical protein